MWIGIIAHAIFAEKNRKYLTTSDNILQPHTSKALNINILAGLLTYSCFEYPSHLINYDSGFCPFKT